jgi:predicted porin
VQAATSNVEIYGLFVASLDFVDPDSPTAESPTKVSSHASRFGFRGKEDPGGGLAAVWGLNPGLRWTLAVTRSAAVACNAGLQNKTLGKVLLGGKLNTPHKMATVKLDVFGDSLGDDSII